MILRLFLVLFLISGPVHATEDKIAAAQKFFNESNQLSDEFDPAAADLYAPTAYIKNTRYYPHGLVREMIFPAEEYKELIRTTMPLAKMRDDRNIYSDVTYTEEGDGVRINATRHSVLKNYDSPISVLIKPDGTGKWLIYEQISESRPF